ncbi:efflux RND transporter periplasmic adaptor subunit [Roseibium sp.]|uniref:efflux RND transporter periplasmic adaptor subunit n=1 Tax=Roseibium sp. TaxID=1936156 RepID=UPI003A97034F
MSIFVRRVIIWGLLVLAATLGIAYAMWPRPVPVDLMAIERGSLTVSIDEEGETRIREVYEVNTPVTGRVLRVEREAGDEVVADFTVIAQLQPIDPEFLDLRTEAEMRASLEASRAGRDLAEAAVSRARAELSFAETDLERIRQLANTETVSQRRLDEARLAHDTKKAELATAEATLNIRIHELERAETQLISPVELIRQRDSCACIPLYAPVNGKVLRILKKSEGVLPAGTVIAEVGDPRDLEIIVDLLSADAVRVEPGLRVLIDEWGGDAPLNGRVKRVEPFGFTKVSALGIEEQRVNVVVQLTDSVDAYGKLAHGFRVEAAIVLWEGDDILTLPLTALFRSGDDWAVFVVEDGVAVRRTVQRGHANGLEVEIVGGLSEGDTVVVHPGNRVDDGMAVVAR